ncbi:MAG: transposase [Desulfocapsaceae bacterium]|nr:transposase [Desulfocapsaceae bacterium]
MSLSVDGQVVCHQIECRVLQAPSVHVDETSCRVEKKNHWIHVYYSGGTTLKLLHCKRGKEAIVELNIIPRYGGVIIVTARTTASTHLHSNLS